MTKAESLKIPEPCRHQWGTEGMHSNEFCKKCFVNRPKGESNYDEEAVEQEKHYGSNAGIRCDTDDGPCSCGAWH